MSFNAGQSLFDQVDTNRDGKIDIGEFKQWASGAGGLAGAGAASSFQSSSFNSSGYDAGVSTGLVGGGFGGSSSFESSASYGSGGYGADISAGNVDGGWSGYDSGAVSSSYGADTSFVNQGYDASSAVISSQSAVQTYATDSQGIYQDPNPQIIHRPAALSSQTYTQNIHVRYLQPPPVPPPGPLIIKEIRPPQPPAPPPLRVRQQAPPPPQGAPIVLREQPPTPPAPIATQTVIRRLPGAPVPPRSVIVERLGPLPPRPGDIIVDKWLPYGARAERRTIVQRAPPLAQYNPPRNVIINYEGPKACIVRQIHKHGVIRCDPSSYMQQYSGQLLDSGTLAQKASAIGISELLSIPGGIGLLHTGHSTTNCAQDAGGHDPASYGSSGGFGAGGSSSFESSSFSSSSGDAGCGVGGFGSVNTGFY